MPSSLASRYFSPDPISLLKAWASRLRRDALQSPRQTSIQHPLQIWAQRERLREQDWRDALGSTEAAAMNFVQTVELFNKGVLKTCWQVCRSLHIQGQARLRIGASAIQIIPGQIKRAARDSQAACGSFIGGSWIASDLSSALTPLPSRTRHPWRSRKRFRGLELRGFLQPLRGFLQLHFWLPAPVYT